MLLREAPRPAAPLAMSEAGAASSSGRPLDSGGASSEAEEPAIKRPRVDGGTEPTADATGAGHADPAAGPAAAAAAVGSAATLQLPDAPGVLLTCERDVSGKYRKETIGLFHRAAAALGTKFAFSSSRIDGSPNVLFIACCEDEVGAKPAKSAALKSACRDCAEAAGGKCAWCAPTTRRESKAGVPALVEQVLQSIGRRELSRPASPALIRLIPIQMRVQPGTLDVSTTTNVKPPYFPRATSIKLNTACQCQCRAYHR